MIIAHAQKLKSEGATEENNLEFNRLVHILRTYNNAIKHNESLNKKQKDLLKLQIHAFRLIMHNKPLPKHLNHLLFSQDVPTELSRQVATEAKHIMADEKQNADLEIVKNPYQHLVKPTTFAELQQRFLIPSVLPTPINPLDIKLERERFIKNRAEYRIKELESLPSTISSNSSLKLKALIELKSLKLLDFQAKLKSSILSALSQQTTLATALDRSAFRHMKKPSLREARQTEKQERAQRSERDKREKQKHVDYLDSILTHAREFMAFHRGQSVKLSKLTNAVVRFHQNAAKEEERRMQRVSADRLNALKANDEEAYMKLLDKSKDTRITHLLSQTNQFLKTLTNAVQTQKSTVAEVVEVKKDDDDDDEPKDYYDTAHAIKEPVYEQPSILVGGTLKEYQLKGLQWMVSLYNNRLNGILADEMGLGKTIQTLAMITYLIEKKKQPGPYLVIVPLSTITNWVIEFEKWAPAITKIVYKGSPNERRNLQMQVRAGQFNVLLTTYEYIINPKDRPVLCRVKWVHMIIDEGHRMKNANSRLSTTLMQFYSARYRLILTGTPLQVNFIFIFRTISQNYGRF